MCFQTRDRTTVIIYHPFSRQIWHLGGHAPFDPLKSTSDDHCYYCSCFVVILLTMPTSEAWLSSVTD